MAATVAVERTRVQTEVQSDQLNVCCFHRNSHLVGQAQLHVGGKSQQGLEWLWDSDPGAAGVGGQQREGGKEREQQLHTPADVKHVIGETY